jgi:hypothetical protein
MKKFNPKKKNLLISAVTFILFLGLFNLSAFAQDDYSIYNKETKLGIVQTFLCNNGVKMISYSADKEDKFITITTENGNISIKPGIRGENKFIFEVHSKDSGAAMIIYFKNKDDLQAKLNSKKYKGKILEIAKPAGTTQPTG